MIGTPGSGKTYCAEYLSKKGINALDADMIDNLVNWFDKQNNIVQFSKDADNEWLNTHDWKWDNDYLKQFLDKQTQDTYIFGIGNNYLESRKLFDKTYCLCIDKIHLKDRLSSGSRENDFGKTEEQLQNILGWVDAFTKNVKQTKLN